MKEIILTKGKKTLVDDQDFDWLNQFKWHYNARCYAVRTEYKPKKHTIFMHREIIKTPKGLFTDHKNGNTLDNRRDNLRVATSKDNQRNQKVRLGSISGLKGVSLDRGHKKWKVAVGRGKGSYVGHFEDKKEAAIAYNKVAKEKFGEFARLNYV
jgi:hypothetical protein